MTVRNRSARDDSARERTASDRTARRPRKVIAGVLIAMVMLLVTGTAAHAFIVEILVYNWVTGDDPFDGDCEESIDLVPCDLPGGQGVPSCSIEVSSSGLDGFVPVAANFTIEAPSSNPFKSATYAFADGVTSDGPITDPSFKRVFTVADVGQHEVTVTAKLEHGTCSDTYQFDVRPKPWLFITSDPVPGLAMQFELRTSGAVDNKPINTINWDFGGGAPVDCHAWCNERDVVVEFPSPGTYEVTATSGIVVPGGLSHTITLEVGSSGAQPKIIPPPPPVAETPTEVVPVQPVPSDPSTEPTVPAPLPEPYPEALPESTPTEFPPPNGTPPTTEAPPATGPGSPPVSPPVQIEPDFDWSDLILIPITPIPPSQIPDITEWDFPGL